MQALGATLRSVRTEAGLSARDIATAYDRALAGSSRRTQTSTATVSRWEAGAVWPRDADLVTRVYADEAGADWFGIWEGMIARLKHEPGGATQGPERSRRAPLQRYGPVNDERRE